MKNFKYLLEEEKNNYRFLQESIVFILFNLYLQLYLQIVKLLNLMKMRRN